MVTFDVTAGGLEHADGSFDHAAAAQQAAIARWIIGQMTRESISQRDHERAGIAAQFAISGLLTSRSWTDLWVVTRIVAYSAASSACEFSSRGDPGVHAQHGSRLRYTTPATWLWVVARPARWLVPR